MDLVGKLVSWEPSGGGAAVVLVHSVSDDGALAYVTEPGSMDENEMMEVSVADLRIEL